MSSETPTITELLVSLVSETRGLREDMRRRAGLPDVRIGKNKKHPGYEGKTASECPPDVLLDYAELLEWKSDKSRAEGKMEYVAKDERAALMCRRWAAVNRGAVAAPERTFRRQEEPQPDAQDGPREPATKWNTGGWSDKGQAQGERR